MKHGKTWMAGMLLAVLLLAMAGCGGADASKAAIDYGTSEIYTEADRQQAALVARERITIAAARFSLIGAIPVPSR